METNSNLTLQRTFGLRESVTITVGTVVGVGLFTVGANVVGIMGSGVIAATLTAMVISIYPALLYAEMGAALPFAGGTYQYASKGLGRPFGMLAAWNFIISLVAVTSGEALAFSYYFKTMFEAMGISLPIGDVPLGCLIVGIFILTNWRGVELTGRLQNGFLFFFWGVAIIWFLAMIPRVNIGFIDGNNIFEPSPGGFISAVALIWWCFAGFETCCAMGEEIKYPQVNIPRALFLAPFIVFIVTASFQWFLLAIVPADSLPAIADAAAPYADGMKTAGILGFPLIMLCAGIALGGDFSTLNASVAVPPRYLFTMARDGVMPAVFAKVHPKYKTPWAAILFLGLLTILLTSTGSIIYIASLSLFADLFYYVIGICAALGLRKRHPSLTRPFRAPFLSVGAPVSAVIYLVMLVHLGKEALISGIVWCLLGLIIFFLCTKKYGKREAESAALELEVTAVAAPSESERSRMDRQFTRWRAVTAVLFLAVCALYLIPYLI